MIDYNHRSIVIATMHGKEEVIAPLLLDKWKMNVIVPSKLNTDLLGTFSGEIERAVSPVESARLKCLKGMELAKTRLGISSEGSFGPHPYIPFVSCNEELMIFMDKDEGIEIVERRLSTTTNYFIKTLEDLYDLKQTINDHQLPITGVLLVGKKENELLAKKDLNNPKELEDAFLELQSSFSTIELQTDMRAHKNPLRMKVIQELADQLISRIEHKCPSCQTPGFGKTGSKPGLPCSLCGSPTKSTLSIVHGCIKCDFTSEQIFPHGKQHEDPTYCDICNP